MRTGCRSALEPGCVYPNKGPRRDANASAAEAVPSGTRYYLFSENFSPGRPGSSAERHPQQNTQRVRAVPGEKYLEENLI